MTVAFRTLGEREAAKFRKWARDNYKVLDRIEELWHPVVRAECAQMNRESEMSKPERFVEVYRKFLKAEIERKPGEFAMYRDDTAESYADRVAMRMVATVVAGKDINVSDAMRKAARLLHIGTTRAAIFTFLREG